MKVAELLEAKPKEIYHASDAKFTRFHSNPTWFSMNKKDAKGWHASGNSKQPITYICQYTGGKIASEEEAATIAKKIWPDNDFIYSMYDKHVGEFEADDIQKFFDALKKAGYSASYVDDYDPNSFDKGSSRSLCVFDPSKDVKIISELKEGKNLVKGVWSGKPLKLLNRYSQKDLTKALKRTPSAQTVTIKNAQTGEIVGKRTIMQ